MMIVLCLILLSFVVNFVLPSPPPSEIIPVTINYSEDQKTAYYIVTITMGSPSFRSRLTVDLSEHRLILFKDTTKRSNSFSSLRDAEDILFIDGKKYRVPIYFDLERTTYESSSFACPDCDGVFGMASSSFVWKIWSDIGFHHGFLMLGEISYHFDETDTALVECDCCVASQDGSGLCKAAAKVEGHGSGGEYNLVFAMRGNTKVPEAVYNSYINGKNLFEDEYEWDPLYITIYSHPSGGEGHCPKPTRLLARDYKEKEINLRLGGEDLVSRFGSNRKFFLLEPDHESNDTITIGINAWKSFIIHKDQAGEAVLIRQHESKVHAADSAVFLFSLLYWLVSRSKLTRMPDITTEGAVSYGRWLHVDVIMHALAIPIAMAAQYTTHAVRVLNDYPVFYVSIQFLVSLFSFVTVICTIFFAVSNERGKRYFMLTVIRSFVYENLLFTGMLLLVLERRTDGLTSFIACIIAGAHFYSVSFHGVVLTIYHMLTKTTQFTSPRHAYFFYYSAYCYPLLYTYYAIVTFHLIMRPLIEIYCSLVSPELVTPLILLVYCIITNISVYIARLYARKLVMDKLNQQHTTTPTSTQPQQ
jgi:hypothetical protein